MYKFPFIFVALAFISCGQKSDKEVEKQTNINDNIEGSISNSLNRQLLYHGDCSYYLSETTGWIANADPVQMSDYIKTLVMYEPDSSIKHSKPIGIYSNVIFKEDYKDTTINGFLKGEKQSAIERGENVIDDYTVKTRDRKNAIIRKYLNDKTGEYFGISYIDEPKYIIMVTYTTKDFDDFNRYYHNFLEIVQSYEYSGTIVIDETRKN